MASIDTSGHDVNKVGIPVSGMTCMAPRGSAVLSQANMADPNFTPPAAYVRLGLRKTDGAPDWAEAPAAPIELYEEGYEVSPRTGTLQVTQIFAQTDDVLRAQVRGVAVASGVQDIDIDNFVECMLYTEDLFLMPDGSYELDRKLGATAKVTSVVPAKNTRGEITGTQVTWKVSRSPELGNVHYRHARIAADATPDPVIVSVAPAGQAVGEQVVISGYNFTGTTGITIDGTAVVDFIEASGDTLVATIPTGAAGAADVIVTTADGSSAAFSYTVA